MEITTLNSLQKLKLVTESDNGIIIHVQKSMIIRGENRLSYSTIFRLIECCREYHWIKDIKPFINRNKIDSICKSIKGEFKAPIIPQTDIYIFYKVSEIRSKGYLINFWIKDVISERLLAKIWMVNVFVSPKTLNPVVPPGKIVKILDSLS